MFCVHLVLVWYFLVLVKELLHFGLCVGHILDFESALLHVHVDFVVQFERVDARVNLVQQRADHPRHDHEFVRLQVDVRLHFALTVQHL